MHARSKMGIDTFKLKSTSMTCTWKLVNATTLSLLSILHCDPLCTVIMPIPADKTKSPSDVQGLNEVDKLRLTRVRLYINELLSGYNDAYISGILITHTSSLSSPSAGRIIKSRGFKSVLLNAYSSLFQNSEVKSNPVCIAIAWNAFKRGKYLPLIANMILIIE